MSIFCYLLLKPFSLKWSEEDLIVHLTLHVRCTGRCSGLISPGVACENTFRPDMMHFLINDLTGTPHLYKCGVPVRSFIIFFTLVTGSVLQLWLFLWALSPMFDRGYTPFCKSRSPKQDIQKHTMVCDASKLSTLIRSSRLSPPTMWLTSCKFWSAWWSDHISTHTRTHAHTHSW